MKSKLATLAFFLIGATIGIAYSFVTFNSDAAECLNTEYSEGCGMITALLNIPVSPISNVIFNDLQGSFGYYWGGVLSLAIPNAILGSIIAFVILLLTRKLFVVQAS